jgi:hypothetical protein
LIERRYFLSRLLTPAKEQVESMGMSLRKRRERRSEGVGATGWRSRLGEEFNYLIDEFKDIEKVFTDMWAVHFERPIRQVGRILTSKSEGMEAGSYLRNGIISRSFLFFRPLKFYFLRVKFQFKNLGIQSFSLRGFYILEIGLAS